LTLLATFAVASNPPVLGWSNQEGAFAQGVRAGAAVPVGTALKSHISLGGRNAVVFSQDQLSVEDITKYGGVYGGDATASSFNNIKSAMDAAKESLVLPSVSGSLLANLGGNVVTMTAADLENGAVEATAALKSDEATVIVFQLPAVAGAADAAAALKTNDALVGKTFQLLAAADNMLVALLTADAESPLTGATRQAALELSDVDQDEIADNVVEISYGLLRNRRDAAAAVNPNRPQSATAKACKQWPQKERVYPNPNSPQQQGGKTCKPGHAFGVKQKTEIFGTPILMGITVSILIISVMMSGVFCLMVLQTNSKYPSVDDAAIIVSTANE